MHSVLTLWNWILANKDGICNVVAYSIAIASIIVKVTPTLKDDDYLKTVIKWIGKYIALDKYGPNSGASK